MVAAARDADPELEVTLADAASLPFDDSSFDLVVAFMSLQDIDDFEGAISEAARTLEPGGRLCLAIVHPFDSAGQFRARRRRRAPSSSTGSYLARSSLRGQPSPETVSRSRSSSEHRPIQAYVDAIADAGLLVERLRETDVPISAIVRPRSRRWQRMPLFLHVRAVKP